MKSVLLLPGRKEKQRIENEAAWPPLGILYIGTKLKEAGHEVRIIDNSKTQLPVESLVNEIKQENPGVVGISTLTPSFLQGITVAREIKKEIPEVKIVFGNYHATFTYEEILEKYPDVVDYVVIGDDEQAFLELIETLENGGNVKKVKGIALKRENKVVKTPPRPPTQNLDELPIPDRTLLEEEYNSEIMGVIGCSGKFTTMITSRGCPFNCKFCACSAFSNRQIRYRSAENVVEELEILQNQGYEEIGFVDDNFLLNEKRIEKICALIRERDLNLNFWAEGRVDQASTKILKNLASIGCKTIYFGMESGVQHVLDYYGKGTTPELNKKAAKNARKAGIENVIGSFIVGSPTETRKDIRKTFDHILNLKGLDFPQINILSLSPGMELWNMAEEEGHLDDGCSWEEPITAVEVFPSHLEKSEIDNMISDFYEEFVMRPKYLISQIVKTLLSRYRLNLIRRNIESGRRLSSLKESLWSG